MVPIFVEHNSPTGSTQWLELPQKSTSDETLNIYLSNDPQELTFAASKTKTHSSIRLEIHKEYVLLSVHAGVVGQVTSEHSEAHYPMPVSTDQIEKSVILAHRDGFSTSTGRWTIHVDEDYSLSQAVRPPLPKGFYPDGARPLVDQGTAGVSFPAKDKVLSETSSNGTTDSTSSTSNIQDDEDTMSSTSNTELVNVTEDPAAMNGKSANSGCSVGTADRCHRGDVVKDSSAHEQAQMLTAQNDMDTTSAMSLPTSGGMHDVRPPAKLTITPGVAQQAPAVEEVSLPIAKKDLPILGIPTSNASRQLSDQEAPSATEYPMSARATATKKHKIDTESTQVRESKRGRISLRNMDLETVESKESLLPETSLGQQKSQSSCRKSKPASRKQQSFLFDDRFREDELESAAFQPIETPSQDLNVTGPGLSDGSVGDDARVSISKVDKTPSEHRFFDIAAVSPPHKELDHRDTLSLGNSTNKAAEQTGIDPASFTAGPERKMQEENSVSGVEQKRPTKDRTGQTKTSTSNVNLANLRRTRARNKSLTPIPADRRKLQERPAVVFSSTCKQDPSLLDKFVGMGGVIVDADVEKADVLCVKNNTFLRTPKYLIAILLGKAIVNEKWVSDSIKHGHFIDPFLYMPTDRSKEKEWKFTMKDIAQRQEDPSFSYQQLLSGYHVYMTKALVSALTNQNNCDEFVKIAKLCGATAYTRLPNKSNRSPKTTLILGIEDDRQVRQVRALGHILYTKEALVMAVLRGKLELDTEEFRVSMPIKKRIRNVLSD